MHGISSFEKPCLEQNGTSLRKLILGTDNASKNNFEDGGVIYADTSFEARQVVYVIFARWM